MSTVLAKSVTIAVGEASGHLAVSDTRGDGLGFDVLSFDEADESERMIEVKTTIQGKYFPFFVTSNEVRCSVAMAEQYHLYRLFRFTQRPRLYVLHGAEPNVSPFTDRAEADFTTAVTNYLRQLKRESRK